jgi:hypothetical protein
VKLVRPLAITDAMLTSDVPETPPTAWSSATTYSLASRSSVANSGLFDVYESIHPGNLFLWSEDFTNAAWATNPGTSRTANVALAPDGNTTADLLTDSSTSSIASPAYQDVTIPDNTQSYCCSVYVKKTTGATICPGFSIIIYNPTDLAHAISQTAILNTDTGEIHVSGGTWGVTDAGLYWRLWGVLANTGTGRTKLEYAIYPAWSFSLLSFDPTATGSITVWGAQAEARATVGTYIPTTSAAALNLNHTPASSPIWWRKVASAYAVYSGAATYALGAIVTDTTKHRLMESLTNANTGNALTDTAHWLDIGPSNRWAMFDDINGTSTVTQDSMSFTIATVGRINSIGILNVQATQIVISAVASGTEVYNQTFSLRDYSVITGYYDYFFTDVPELTDLVALDLLLYSGMVITVTITGAGAISVGSVVVGLSQDLGETQYGVRLGINDRSKKDDDGFGNYTVVKRAFSRRGTFPVTVRGENVQQVANKVSTIQNLLASYRATPVLWIGSELYSASFVFGFYKSFELEVSLPLQSILSLEIEGLI